MTKAENRTDAQPLFSARRETLKRSQISLAGYNPRKIDEQARKALKRGIKRFGIVGGIIVNENTGYTLVGGHQRLTIADEIFRYPAKTKDYDVEADVVNLSEKEEKELNILLNNPATQGDFDFDKLATLLPDIDLSITGLTDADLAFMDFSMPDLSVIETAQPQPIKGQAPDALERKADIKKKKRDAVSGAVDKVADTDVFLTLEFDDAGQKSAFLERLGVPEGTQVISGQALADNIDILPEQ